jgi:hypothetical protein
MGIDEVAALAASATAVTAAVIYGYLPTNEIGNKLRQPIISVLGKPVVDRHVLAFNVAGLG